MKLMNSSTPMTPSCSFPYLHLAICLNKPTSCIDALHIWFFINGMALNPDKSETILLDRRQRAHSYCNLFSVNVGSCQIPLADHFRILAVSLDKNLSMYNHITALSKFIHCHIHALQHIRSYISRRAPRSRLYRRHIQTVAEDITFCAALVCRAR